MDKEKYTADFGSMHERIGGLFKEMAADFFDDTWADTFTLEETGKKNVTVIYHGKEDFKRFKKECKSNLTTYVHSVFVSDKKIKIVQKKGYNSLSPKAKKNIRAVNLFAVGMLFVCIAMAISVVMCNYISNRSFRETFYSASSIKVDSRVRVIQLSDLHSSSFGDDNTKLLNRIEALAPDIIICTGDIVNSAKDDAKFATNLGRGLSKIAPSYYIYGNNEVESIYDFNLNEAELDKKFGFNKQNRDETALLKIDDSFEQMLENNGIKFLKNETDTIQVKTITIDVYGVLTSNPSAFWSYSEKAFLDYINTNPHNIKITAVHEPFIFEAFQPEFWGDLMVCGHTHGGVVRIPLLGPLFTREGGLFPERGGSFVYGRYDVAGKPLIVSSGLENSTLLRINNQPELVVIDINKF